MEPIARNGGDRRKIVLGPLNQGLYITRALIIAHTWSLQKEVGVPILHSAYCNGRHTQ